MPEAWHWLTGATAGRMPRRHVFLDSEAHSTVDGGATVQRFRCAVATFHQAPKGRPEREETLAFTMPSSLWDKVDDFANVRGRTILWTHNLGYDVRVCRAFRHLVARGWALVAWNMAPQGTWMIWRREQSTLTMVDSASVFPTKLAQIAKWFQVARPPLPSNVDSMDRWLLRCAVDVQILRDAIISYLAWVEREGLGDWQLTGTGQAFAAFRTRFLTHRMLVHWDEDARALERRAMWAGRTEAYWHGTWRKSSVDEWDLTAAYPRIVEHNEVPVELVRTLGPGANVWRWVDEPGYAVVAEGAVETDVPVVPTSHEGRILWPTGKFDTTLWDPELRLVRDTGGTFLPTCAKVYRTAPALSEWARWILSIMDGEDPNTPAWVMAIAKHWSRALIGRIAMRHQTWQMVGETPATDVRWWTLMDRDTGEMGELVQVGRKLWQSGEDTDWSQSIPAINGWTVSRCREIMTRLLLDLGDRVALYMDTDSILVPSEHHDLVARVAHEGGYRGLRVKRSWGRVAIGGPRQLLLEGQVRVAGVPREAQRMPDGSLTGEVWESLRGAVRNRRTDAVRVVPRRWRLRPLDARRVVGPDGWTDPVRLLT